MLWSGKKKITNEMPHECRVTHVLWVIWDEEFDGGIHFLKFGLRNCQCQVIPVQIRSDLKIQNFLTRPCLSCLVLPQDPKNVFFTYGN